MIAQRKTQYGFTLIELMIALLISSIMITVAVSQLLQSRKVYFVQEADARIEENARYALEVLRDNVKLAGYVDTSGASIPDLPPARFYNGDCGAPYEVCTDDGDDAASESDHFAVLLNRSYTINASDGSATLITGSDQPLIEGIDRMHVLYGLTDQQPASARPERYVSAATINALGTPAPGSSLELPWDSVSSIRIILLTGTGYEDSADVVDTRTYFMGDAAPFTPTNNGGDFDGNRRKLFSSTIVMNNANL